MKTHYALTRLSLLTAGLLCAGAAFARHPPMTSAREVLRAIKTSRRQHPSLPPASKPNFPPHSCGKNTTEKPN